jgi:hypothetical protein
VKSILCALLATISVLATSCASFRGDALRGPESLQASPQPKSVRVVLTGRTSMNGKAADAPPMLLTGWSKGALEAYSKSALFSSVEAGPGEADLRAEISIENTGEGSFVLAFLSGFTFLVIPARAVDRIAVRTQFVDRSGKVLGTYEKQGEMRTWFHLFMIPVMPFKFPAPVANGMFSDLHRSTLDEALKAGIL